MKDSPKIIKISTLSTLILLVTYLILSFFDWHNPTADTVIGLLFGFLFLFNLVLFIRQIRNNQE